MGKQFLIFIAYQQMNIKIIGKIKLMKPSIEKLQKFFKLEADRGYDNKAVMGGLSQMLDSWISDARIDRLDENLIQAISSRLKDYDHLSESSRKESLHGLWSRIKRDLGETEVKPVQDQANKTKPESDKKIVEPEPEESTPQEIDDTIDEVQDSSTQISSRSPQDEVTAALNAEVTVLKNVGPRYAKTLERLGIFTLGDMVYHFPRRYDDYSKLKPINRLIIGEEVTIIGSVQSIISRTIRSGRNKLSEAVINDGSAALRLTWFNQPWIAQRIKKGMQIVVSGKVDQYLGRLTMSNPEWESLEQKHLHTNRIVPVYPLTARITQRWLRNLMHKVVTYWSPKIRDHVPESITQSAEIIPLPDALEQIHFPDSWNLLEKARYRLAFDEIFLLQLGVLQQKQAWQELTAIRHEISDEWMATQFNNLPYELTGAQKKAIAEIRSDLSSGRPMNRLLQGDVGSGKTIVAAMGIALVTSLGFQAAIMAPTSILAEQHYSNLISLLSGDNGLLKPDQIRLIMGSTSENEKNEIIGNLASGKIKLIIGTHAIIEDPVEFNNLQLVIIDEQHRFGVKQRAVLRSKGSNPHLLVMTATPIPRSLALTIYGDLDVTVINEMPPGRKEIETYLLYPRERERAYKLIQNQIKAGHQAFVIYPLVEESEKSEDKAATEEQLRLQEEIFPKYCVGLLHGKMKATEKDDVMKQFRNGEIQILVSTSVVEVGVDIPNATVMVVEGANRFGLAQLHQFRGRVGRGGTKSYCLLIPKSSDDFENERLKVMVETNDGFILAEHDLEHRGAGDFLGTRQSGFAELKMANLTDIKLIENARKHAQSLFEIDPRLEMEKHNPLAGVMKEFWNEGQGELS